MAECSVTLAYIVKLRSRVCAFSSLCSQHKDMWRQIYVRKYHTCTCIYIQPGVHEESTMCCLHTVYVSGESIHSGHGLGTEEDGSSHVITHAAFMYNWSEREQVPTR